VEELGAKRAIAKADWEYRQKLEEELKQIHRPYYFDLDDDDQDDTHRDKRIKQRWNVKLLQHRQDTDMQPYSPSPQQCRSHTKSSARKKRSKKTRRKKTGDP